MNNWKTTERFDQSVKGLNQKLYEQLIHIPNHLKEQVQEIRLRVNRPVAIYCSNRMYYITEKHQITTTIMADKMLIATGKDIAETFQNICGYSVYSHQNEIKDGFITMYGGHRAGICGTAVYHHGQLSNIRDISSINIRVARQINGAANKLMQALGENLNGILLCGAPASGKTTILRDLARQLSSNSSLKVTVIDERGELAGTCKGVCQNDLGQSDVLDGYAKGEGIMQALRCLSPDLIICDEVGTKDDVTAIEESLNAGVSVIASIHAGTKREFLKRPQAKKLMETGAFSKLVFLKSRSEPGEIKEICTWEDVKNASISGGCVNGAQHIMGRHFNFPAINHKSKIY